MCLYSEPPALNMTGIAQYVMGFFLWRAPQQMLQTHRSLKAYCATLWWRWLVFFFRFFLVMGHRWNEIDMRKLKYSGLKPCPNATLPTTNPTWNYQGSNPGHCGDRPATNRLSHGTATWWFCFGLLRRVVIKCFDTLGESTASFFKVTELVQLDKTVVQMNQ
jgi:hypothetical protein